MIRPYLRTFDARLKIIGKSKTVLLIFARAISKFKPFFQSRESAKSDIFSSTNFERLSFQMSLLYIDDLQGGQLYMAVYFLNLA